MNDISLFTPTSGVNLIIKTAGNACNINCKYCFEKAKEVTTKFIEPSFLDTLINTVEKTCTIVFHGGEPLIVGIEHFERMLQIAEKYYPNKVTAIRIQTNGTLIDENWIDLLYNKYKHLNIEIAISLDGTLEMNSLRTDYSNLNTFSRVLSSFELLNTHEISAGMLSVISKRSLPYAKQYIDFINSIPNIKFVKMNALFNIENNQLSADSITPSEYAKFIVEASKWYLSTKLYQKIAIEPFLSIIQRINNKKSRYCNYSSRKCFNYLSIYPDGSIGPCDCLSVNGFCIDDISKSLDTNIINALNSSKCKDLFALISSCDNCDIKDFCMGGCLSQRYYFINNSKLMSDFCYSKHYFYNTFKHFTLK